jgi:MFS family permease
VSKLGFTISSGFIGNNLERIGRKNAVIIGLLITGAAAFIYGTVAFSDNEWVFYWVSFCMRICTGVGDGFMKVGIFAICNLEFTTDSEKYFGMV